jgi:hypothetical protein
MMTKFGINFNFLFPARAISNPILFFNFFTEVKRNIKDNIAITNIDIIKEIYSPFIIVLLIASLV